MIKKKLIRNCKKSAGADYSEGGVAVKNSTNFEEAVNQWVSFCIEQIKNKKN